MLETNSKFISKLRNDKIAAPTVRRFTKAGWKKNYAETGTDTDEERIVYEAGIWVSDALQSLWDHISSLNLQLYAFDDLVIRPMALSFAESRCHMSPDSHAPPKGLTSDHGTTGLGDALWRALSFLHSIRASLVGTAAPSDDVVHELLQTCSAIYVLEFFIGRVIHCGWQLTFDAEGPIFGPQPSAIIFSENEAIAHEIRAEDYLEFYMVFHQTWAEGGLRDEAPQHLRLVTRTPTRATFRVVRQPPDEMPGTVPLFAMDLPRWLYPLLATTPNELTRLPIQQVVGAWLLLHDVFEIIYERESRVEANSAVSCVLHRDDLLAVFSQLQYPRAAAEQVIAFFTYDWSRHESLWGAPLVRIGNHYHPFLPAILLPNISRSVDLWLKRFTFTTGNGKRDTLVRRRGELFEGHVRAALAEEIVKLERSDVFIFPQTAFLAGHEIDLLLRVGSTIYVADAKFLKFPANPNEIGNYYRELEHGAHQVLERCASLQGLKRELKSMLNFQGDERNLKCSPLVVTGHPYGAGMILHDVPCLTLDMLEMVFREDRYVMNGFDGRVEGVRQISLVFDRSLDGFEEFFAHYVHNPAAVWFRTFAVRSVPVRSSVIPPDTEVRFKHYHVDIARTQEREAYCESLVEKWDQQMARYRHADVGM